ncbi:MAG: QueT transporter family protein [Oscillospiraceae bacterium]|nr:QueT transporter family protein [Oscillospiraceae bacterium]
MQKKQVQNLAYGAIIAALYVTLTLVFAPISFREVQVRISEALTILPLFTPAAVPGLFVGCLLANLISGAAVPDVIFGSLATLIGAIGTYLLRSRKPVFGTIPPILSNVLIIPFVLRYAYAIDLPIPLMMLTVGLGEVISCGILGMMLYYVLDKRRDKIFRTEISMENEA